MQSTGGNGYDLQQFEYCYAAEDFDPAATHIKIYIPKLMSAMGGGSGSSKQSVDRSSFLNDKSCSVGTSTSVSGQQYIVARVVAPRNHDHPWLKCNNKKYGTDNCPNRQHNNICPHMGKSVLKPCYHDHWHYDFDNEATGGNIPQGARMICMFMENNISDCWVTRFICEY